MRRTLELLALAALAACGPEVPASTPRPTSRVDALRPDTPNTDAPPPFYAAGDVVERFVADGGAGVAVHYTRMGQHRVPSTDSDGSGVPDFVESVQTTYAQVLAQYHGPWGFRAPPDDALVPGDNGGDARFDVYLVDFALRADGAYRKECLFDPVHCPGYMVQENDFVGYGYPTALAGIVTVSSHEYFHAVQAGYSAVQGVNVTEGTAVWATERFAPQLDDLEGFAGGYLALPERSLDQEPSTAVDPYAYGLGLWFECVSAQRGPETVREMWERIDGGASWLAALDRGLAADGGLSLADVMKRCAEWNVFTGARARLGYGHARADRLPLANVTEAPAPLQVPRSRMFRASSRYWHVTALPANAVAWWKAADDAPDGGSQGIAVRLAADVSGTPAFAALPENTVAPVSGSAAFVLVSNLAIGGPSVPIGFCVGGPAFVDGCRAVDSGVPEMDAGPSDGGDPMMPPPPCGCGVGPGPVVLLLCLTILRSRFMALSASKFLPGRGRGRGLGLPSVEDVRQCGLGSRVDAADQDHVQVQVQVGNCCAQPRWTAGALAPVLLMVALPSLASAQEVDAGAPVEIEPALLDIDAGSSVDAGPLTPALSPLGGEGVPREMTTVVTAGRLPQQLKDTTVAIEVISRRQIQESGARDVAELLQARPGIETAQNVGTTGIRMGGLGPEYNLVMVDGQRIAGRINGGVDLTRITVENIEQIEIVKGPSSVLWGSEALAGTINIITRTPTKPLEAQATASYGTLNQVTAAGAAGLSGEDWSLSVSGGFERRDPYDLDLSTPATNGSSLTQGQGSVKATYGGRGANSAKLEGGVDLLRRVQLGVDEGASSAFYNRSSRDNLVEARVNGRLPVLEGALAASASISWFDRRFILDQQLSQTLDDVQDSQDTVGQVDLQVSQTIFETHTLLSGGTLLLEQLTSPRLDGGRGSRGRGAVFLQDAWVPQAAPVQIAAGIRGDFDTFFGAAFTPRLALRADPTTTLTLRASTGLGFRAPSFQELLIDFENPSVGYTIQGNPTLRPERSWGSSVGAQWSPGTWLFTLNLFWNELWEMIGFEEIGGNNSLLFRYANITRARTRGVEVSAGVSPWPWVQLEVGYTLTDAKNLLDGLPLEAQAVHRGWAQARFRKREWGLTALVRFSVTGPRPFLTGDPAVPVDWSAPYAILDARVAKTLGEHVELFVAGMNLAGAGNPNDLPIPPRSIFGGATVRY